MLKSQDGGTTWAPVPTGYNLGFTKLYFQAPQNGWTVGRRGIILHYTGGILYDAPQVFVEPAAPADFALGRNYPNPFNPSTTLTFTLGSPTPVTVEVFDVLGRRVAVLLDGTLLEAGEHRITFDAAGLPAGVYFARMTAEAMQLPLVNKMVLIK